MPKSSESVQAPSFDRMEMNGRLIWANIFEAKLIKSIYRLNAFEKLKLKWRPTSQMNWMRDLGICISWLSLEFCMDYRSLMLGVIQQCTLGIAWNIDKFPSKSHVNIYRHHCTQCGGLCANALAFIQKPTKNLLANIEHWNATVVFLLLVFIVCFLFLCVFRNARHILNKNMVTRARAQCDQ